MMGKPERTPPSSVSESPSRSPSPGPRGGGHTNGRSGNGNHAYDSANRERDLAEQLRRRAVASRETKRPVSRSPSRTPPSRSSSSTPPPERAPSRRLSTRSRSPEQRRASSGSAKRLRDEEREYERRKRRSGRDPYDEDRLDAQSSSSRRRTPVRIDSEDFDESRSQRSGYSQRATSRDLDGHSSRSRTREDERRSAHRRRGPGGYDPYYGRAPYDSRYYRDGYAEPPRPSMRHRRSPSPVRRSSSPDPEDYELRSVFCSQLAARLTRRDLGEFFEEKLGEGSVKDVRVVTDRITGRSKGIGYVELRSEDRVEKAIACSGSNLYGIPILVQQTEAARNRGEGASTAQTPIRPNLPNTAAGIPPIDPNALATLPLPPHLASNAAARLNGTSALAAKQSNAAARLYVGSLHFDLVDTDVKAVFEPFGEIEDVDLHREPTGKSKGFAFVQFKQVEDAEKAIEHMNGFELAGRNIKVGHVNARGQEGRVVPQMQNAALSGAGATLTSAFDEGGGGGLTAHSRANLMQMLARSDPNSTSSTSSQDQTVVSQQVRPASIPQATSRAVLLKNMFNPAEETDDDWDTDLAEDVRQECEDKYGKVEKCHVDRDSSGEIWLRFTDVSGAAKAIAGLNGRWFGGRPVSAEYISESFLAARLG